VLHREENALQGIAERVMSRMANLVAVTNSKSGLLTNALRDATLACYAL